MVVGFSGSQVVGFLTSGTTNIRMQNAECRTKNGERGLPNHFLHSKFCVLHSAFKGWVGNAGGYFAAIRCSPAAAGVMM
jgi:hypothetical protein